MYEYDGRLYSICIKKKRIKNTYIRIKEGKLYITTNYLTSRLEINKIILDNKKSIDRMFCDYLEKEKRRAKFFWFGTEYKIIYDDEVVGVIMKENTIFVKDKDILFLWMNKEIENIFRRRFDYWYSLFDNVPDANLVIRKMKSRWGVCNRKNNNITLNYELYRYEMDCLDYVIVHELSHFKEANHSKKFWNVVSKYYPNYKEARDKLKK